MSSVALNPKLNLTEAQQQTFQEVLAETTKEVAQDYVKANVLSTQNNAIWKSIGAAGMNSTGYRDLLMAGINSSLGNNLYNPFYGFDQSINPFTGNSSNYLNHFYQSPTAFNQSHFDYSTIYNRLNEIHNRRFEFNFLQN